MNLNYVSVIVLSASHYPRDLRLIESCRKSVGSLSVGSKGEKRKCRTPGLCHNCASYVFSYLKSASSWSSAYVSHPHPKGQIFKVELSLAFNYGYIK